MPAAFTILWVLVLAVSLFFVFRTLPLRNEIKGDWLVVTFCLWRKKIIDIAGVQFQEVPEDVLKYMKMWYEGNFHLGASFKSFNSIKYCYSTRYKNRHTGDVYHIYISGKGRRVYFESNGQKYVVDLMDK